MPEPQNQMIADTKSFLHEWKGSDPYIDKTLGQIGLWQLSLPPMVFDPGLSLSANLLRISNPAKQVRDRNFFFDTFSMFARESPSSADEKEFRSSCSSISKDSRRFTVKIPGRISPPMLFWEP